MGDATSFFQKYGAQMTSAFGSGMSATASIRAGNAENALAKYNAQVAENNAKVADYSAQDAVERGAADETAHRIETKRLIGRQRVSLAAQGQDLGSGSAVEIQADTARQSEVDALEIRANAAREQWGYRVAASNARVQAQDQLAAGEIAKQKGKNAAFQTILTDASSLLYKKYGSK